eukprot:s351_g20.t1
MAVEAIPLAQTKGLPKAYRGRCQAAQPKRATGRPLTKPPREGEYMPAMEIHTFSTSKEVKQVRRLDSICRGLRRIQEGHPPPPTLLHEWRAALRCEGFKGNFPKWAMSHPEIGPLPWELPSLNLATTIYQIAKHETNMAIHHDYQTWQRKLSFRQHLDMKYGGYQQAFQKLKNNSIEELQAIQHQETRDVIVVPQGPDLILYAGHCDCFDLAAQVEVDGTLCTVHAIDSHSLLVTPQAQRDWPMQATMTQPQLLCTPSDIFHNLNQLWHPIWTKDTEAPDQHAISQALQHMPSVDIPDCPPDLGLWLQAVKDLKPHSARGVDRISARELQAVPTEAIRDLMFVMTSYAEGFPPWFMWCRTVPVPKRTGPINAGQIRPISVLAQCYRLRSKVQSRHLMHFLCPLFPAGITGFVPHKGPYNACYDMQWTMEKATSDRIDVSGVSLDILKCFNSIDHDTTATALQAIGVPHTLVSQWRKSMQVLRRSWVLHRQVSEPFEVSRGCPEEDPLSVVMMLVISTSWIAGIMHQTATAFPQATPPLVTAYADNWGWLVSDCRLHDPVLTLTKAYVRCQGLYHDGRLDQELALDEFLWPFDFAQAHCPQSARGSILAKTPDSQ